MKKLTSLLLALLMLMGMMAVPAMAADEVSVYLFGEKLSFDVPAQIINGRTMVPMRKIFEELGATVDWDNDTRTVTSVREDKTIILTIDSYTMHVNGEAVTLDTAPCIIDGRTLVPARAVSESFDLKVDWDGTTRSVLITDGSDPVVSEEDTFDYMSNFIMSYGEYDPTENEYMLLGEDDVVYIYSPTDEEIAIIYVEQDTSDGTSYAVIVGYYKVYYSDGYINFEFSDGSEEWMMADFDGPGYTVGEPKGEYSAEVEDSFMELMLVVIQNRIEPSLYETFGLTLEDIDISLN